MSEQRTTSPAAQPWPDGVVARYLTIAGATVDITGSGPRAYARCTGCLFGRSATPSSEAYAHQDAQAHAEKCRALPRPEAQR